MIFYLNASAFEFAKTHKGACANILTQASPLPTERTEAFMEMKGNIVMSRLRKLLFKCNYHISSTFRTFRNYFVGRLPHLVFLIFKLVNQWPLAGGIGEA